MKVCSDLDLNFLTVTMILFLMPHAQMKSNDQGPAGKSRPPPPPLHTSQVPLRRAWSHDATTSRNTASGERQ